jgi:hypothetical protein
VTDQPGAWFKWVEVCTGSLKGLRRLANKVKKSKTGHKPDAGQGGATE